MLLYSIWTLWLFGSCNIKARPVGLKHIFPRFFWTFWSFFLAGLICCGRSLCAEDDVTIGQDPSCSGDVTDAFHSPSPSLSSVVFFFSSSAPPSGFQRDGGSSCALEVKLTLNPKLSADIEPHLAGQSHKPTQTLQNFCCSSTAVCWREPHAHHIVYVVIYNPKLIYDLCYLDSLYGLYLNSLLSM